LQDIDEQVLLGGLIRAIHDWSASALAIVLVLALILAVALLEAPADPNEFSKLTSQILPFSGKKAWTPEFIRQAAPQ